jgi:hypothetical protein
MIKGQSAHLFFFSADLATELFVEGGKQELNWHAQDDGEPQGGSQRGEALTTFVVRQGRRSLMPEQLSNLQRLQAHPIPVDVEVIGLVFVFVMHVVLFR